MIKEKITWRVDGLDKIDHYDKSRAFVHSFGLKCDMVGWCSMDIKDNKDVELIERIGERISEVGGNGRCCYEKEEFDVDTEWYRLKPSASCEYDYEQGIKAYKLTRKNYIADADDFIVANQQFVDFCTENAFSGVDFVYVKDKGKYKADTHFAIIPTDCVLKASTFNVELPTIHNRNRRNICKMIDELGGNLSSVSKSFKNLQFVDIPLMIAKDDEVKNDFCYVAYEECGCVETLVRKKVADKLLENCFVKTSELMSVRYCDPEKYKDIMVNCRKEEFINNDIIKEWYKSREKDEKKNKPIYKPNEKDAMKLLRKAKKERTEDFNKGLKTKLLEDMDGSLSAIKNIYKISDGCFLGDEYELFKYELIQTETQEFIEDNSTDEVVFEKLRLDNFYVIGRAINGDSIIIRQDESVVVYDHEDPFNSVIYDTIWGLIFDIVA